MGRRLIVASVVALAGCASSPPLTVERLHAACAQGSQSFGEHADCVSKIARDPDYAASAKRDVGTELYVAQAQALADKVRRGNITEADAVLEQTALRAQLEQARRQAVDANADALTRQYMDAQRLRRYGRPILSCSRTAGITTCS